MCERLALSAPLLLRHRRLFRRGPHEFCGSPTSKALWRLEVGGIIQWEGRETQTCVWLAPPICCFWPPGVRLLAACGSPGSGGTWGQGGGAPSFSSRTVGDRTTANGRILPEGQRQPCRPCVCLRQDLIPARILGQFYLQNHCGPKLRYLRSAVCSQAAYPYDTVMAGRASPCRSASLLSLSDTWGPAAARASSCPPRPLPVQPQEPSVQLFIILYHF